MVWSGGIDRLPSGAYRARIRISEHRYQHVTRSKSAAEAWLRSRMIEKVTGPPAVEPTLEAAREQLIERMDRHGYCASYLADFRSLSQRVVAALGPDMKASLLSPTAIKEWADSLKYAPSTRRNMLNALSKLGVPIPRGTRPRIVCKPRRMVTEQQLKALLKQAKPTSRLVLLLAADAGLRRGEIAALHPGDVSEGWLHVHGKGSVMRWVPVLTARLAAALDGPWHGLTSPHGVHDRLRREFGGSVLHGLRHRWVSVLAASGRVSPHELASWAGHSVMVSMRYFHPATIGSRSAESLIALGEGSGLENRRGASHRGFESRPLRQPLDKPGHEETIGSREEP